MRVRERHRDRETERKYFYITDSPLLDLLLPRRVSIMSIIVPLDENLLDLDIEK